MKDKNYYSFQGCQGNLINRGINGADIKVILLVHNNYRNKVALGHQKGQPPASDMKELVRKKGVVKKIERSDLHISVFQS